MVGLLPKAVDIATEVVVLSITATVIDMDAAKTIIEASVVINEEIIDPSLLTSLTNELLSEVIQELV